jgi:C1A family cysteine protease
VEQLNSLNSSTIFGITKFFDLTPNEFKTNYLMNITFNKSLLPEAPIVEKLNFQQLPVSFDWRSKSGVVTAVKNQGQCGSCWAFSATETIESVWALANHPLITLSEQQIVDCDKYDYGCDGGWPYNAYKYVHNAGGQVSESKYPYIGTDGTCHFKLSDVVAKITGWKYITQNMDEKQIQQYIYQYSPVSVCVDASIWQYYKSGVITTRSNCGNSIDHCVQITGWSQINNILAWTVRNSWGSDWGDQGFIHIEMGSNVCSIAEVVTVPII